VATRFSPARTWHVWLGNVTLLDLHIVEKEGFFRFQNLLNNLKVRSHGIISTHLTIDRLSRSSMSNRIPLEERSLRAIFGFMLAITESNPWWIEDSHLCQSLMK